MTNHISHKQIETNIRYSHQLRAEAFGAAVRGIGRGLRRSAQALVGTFT